uniref:EF-hand domain-containing protein n=1 Tax=Macrostomum lignano TaxID=282301 RepID=A0A1I8JCX7_9PLAT
MASDQDLLMAFKTIDKSNSGEITADELRTYLYKKRYNELFVQRYLRLFDRNRDGKITLEEYQNTLKEIPKAQREYSQWRELFETIDKDGNGHITKKELKSVVRQMGSNSLLKLVDFDRFFEEGDSDYSGKLNYREFLDWLDRSQNA